MMPSIQARGAPSPRHPSVPNVHLRCSKHHTIKIAPPTSLSTFLVQPTTHHQNSAFASLSDAMGIANSAQSKLRPYVPEPYGPYLCCSQQRTVKILPLHPGATPWMLKIIHHQNYAPTSLRHAFATANNAPSISCPCVSKPRLRCSQEAHHRTLALTSLSGNQAPMYNPDHSPLATSIRFCLHCCTLKQEPTSNIAIQPQPSQISVPSPILPTAPISLLSTKLIQ